MNNLKTVWATLHNPSRDTGYHYQIINVISLPVLAAKVETDSGSNLKRTTFAFAELAKFFGKTSNDTVLLIEFETSPLHFSTSFEALLHSEDIIFNVQSNTQNYVNYNNT